MRPNGWRKLTAEERSDLCARHQRGGRGSTLTSLARRYRISKTSVSRYVAENGKDEKPMVFEYEHPESDCQSVETLMDQLEVARAEIRALREKLGSLLVEREMRT